MRTSAGMEWAAATQWMVAFTFAAVGRVATTRCRIVTAAELGHLTLRVLYDFATRYKVGITQTHLGARREPKELLGGFSIKSSCSM